MVECPGFSDQEGVGFRVKAQGSRVKDLGVGVWN